MNNPDTMATFATSHKPQNKHVNKHNTENYKNVQHYITPEPEVNPDACEE